MGRAGYNKQTDAAAWLPYQFLNLNRQERLPLGCRTDRRTQPYLYGHGKGAISKQTDL